MKKWVEGEESAMMTRGAYQTRGPIQAYLEYRHGRGPVRIIQQPDPDNNFTAKVRIHDPKAGHAHYDFGLAWAPIASPADADGYYLRPPVRLGQPRGY